MNTPSSFKRGGLRVASFFLAGLAGSVTLSQTSSVAAQTPQVTTVKLTVSKAGFEPKRISVPVGTVHFVVTATEGDHCFAIPSLDVEKRVRAARPLETDVAFERAGEFPFVCCAEGPGTTETGVVVVAPGK